MYERSIIHSYTVIPVSDIDVVVVLEGGRDARFDLFLTVARWSSSIDVDDEIM